MTRRIILEEEEFISGIEYIISRDFFPDLLKYRSETEDQTPLSSKVYQPSPVTFETPNVREINEKCQDEPQISKKDEPFEKNLSLNAFLQKYTSEDDASFDEVMVKVEQRHRAKYPWLYQNEDVIRDRMKRLISLPNIEKQAIEGPNQAAPITWPFKNFNSVMFIPESDSNSVPSKLSSINHHNTRFRSNPFNDTHSEAILAKAASSLANEKLGKIGIDGKELQTSTPQVRGYSFVAMTPSPMPGESETPIMTWGELESTPYRLDGNETPSRSLLGTPSFKIHDTPEREKVAHCLADKISKNIRDKKKEANKRLQTFTSSSSILGGRSPFEKLGSMSPAAQRLATQRLGINKNADIKLRESYSPARCPVSSPLIMKRKSTPKLASNSESLTDNLLKIPKLR